MSEKQVSGKHNSGKQMREGFEVTQWGVSLCVCVWPLSSCYHKGV